MKIHLFLISLWLVLLADVTYAQRDFPKSQDSIIHEDARWYKVDSLSNMGLPKSTLTIINEIKAEALAKSNMPQFLKSNLYELNIRSQFEENYLETFITEREALILRLSPPAKQIIHSILADLYWQYYTQNRWQILDRTVTTGKSSNDMKAWDANKFIQKVTYHYSSSLDNTDLLKSTALENFDLILLTVKGSKLYRPTLFDFLAHEAIDFYKNEEATITKPQDRFIIEDPELLADADAFTRINLTSTDTNSFQLNALAIMQQVIKFHLTDVDPKALIDTDLERLSFVYNHLNNQDKDSLYLDALLKLEKKYAGRPESAKIMEQIASFYFHLNDTPIRILSSNKDLSSKNLVSAKEWCLKLMHDFPESDEAKVCSLMVSSIEEPYIDFVVNKEVIPGKEFPLLVRFKNVDLMHFRLVESGYIDLDQNGYNENKSIISKILSSTPYKSWSVEMPDSADYKIHSVEIIVPSMVTGNYMLLASNNDLFNEKDTTLAYTKLQVSNLAYISQVAPDGSALVYIVNRSNGKPVSGVKAQSFSMEYDYKTREYTRKNLEAYLTETDGSFQVRAADKMENRSLSFNFIKGKDTLVAENYLGLYYRQNESEVNQPTRTYFFTDRAIYRPGQTLYFKGIMVRMANGASKILANEQSIVTLYDVNGQKVNGVNVTTNEYGSFSGSFVIPTSGLTGQMHIDNTTGSVTFNVEEYKRPRFEVTFNPLDSSFKLNETINLSGVAKTYSDVPVTGATVKYRVVRSASFPFFRYSSRIWPPYRVPEAEIASGSLTTGEDGAFTISFTASPDPDQFDRKSPLYTFMVYADVTDINGETRSAETSINVSDKALLLETDLPEELSAKSNDSFIIKSTNLSGEKVPANVKINVYKLKDKSLTLPRIWDDPDTLAYRPIDIQKRLPYYTPRTSFQEKPVREKEIFADSLNTATDSLINFGKLNLTPGRYLVILSSIDKFGELVSVEKEVLVFDPSSSKLPEPSFLWTTLLDKKPTPDGKIRLLAGSSVKSHMLVEMQSNGKIIKHQWFDLSKQRVLEFNIPSDVVGQVNILASSVYLNHNFSENFTLQIPDKSRELKFTFETFRSTLLPGGTEKWKIKITGSDDKPINAEFLAAMYDASLDYFVKHNWNFSLFNQYHPRYEWNLESSFRTTGSIPMPIEQYAFNIPTMREYDQLNWFGYNFFNGYYGMGGNIRSMAKGERIQESEAVVMDDAETIPPPPIAQNGDVLVEDSIISTPPSVRKNLQETAFFFPHLVTNEAGEVWIEFTIPEALTRWNFMGLAHSKTLANAKFSKEVVTKKDLMVTPNLPRFFREGDQMVLQAKINNVTTNPIQGEASLQLFDALTMQPVDKQFSNQAQSSQFSIDASGSGTVNWNVSIPSGVQAVMVRITAVSGNHSDGEEVLIPVLTNRMLVTETMPLPVYGKETKQFQFGALSNVQSSTRINHKLTLEFTSNPAWYAIQALPWLESLERENSDQVFNRFYANSLASHIANSSPAIRNVFETWKNASPDALLSNLEKNQELKSLLLQETPWLMEAKNESEQKQRIAMLFDLNRLASERSSSLQKLKLNQSVNGGWPWFPGMPESRYITQYIVSGLGKLHYRDIYKLEADENTRIVVQQATNYLASRLLEDYKEVLKDKKSSKNDHLSYEHIQFLYSISFLDGLVTVPDSAKPAIEYYSNQARKFWTSKNLYGQSMIALWTGRNGDKTTVNTIMASLREKAISSEEMGTYWRDNRGGYLWYHAPVETQAIIIELFEEFGNNKHEVDRMKTWLLKQKQTNSWKTTTATAEAIYALILRGSDWLSTDNAVSIKLGDQIIDLSSDEVRKEPGAGYFKTSWDGKSINQSMSRITVNKSSDGPAWGAFYLQYFENIDKVISIKGPLSIKKQIFIRDVTPDGPRLKEITPDYPLTVGQQIVVRIEVASDRELEFVHVKDTRASSFEPVNTLSGYQWKSGLGYYSSTRDASTDFFLNYLPKGTHVFEYQLVVSQKGDFSSGVSTVQCLYAPEFSAHSEGIRVIVE